MKKQPDNRHLLDIPENILHELRNSPMPTEEQLSQFDHIRDDFIQMLRSAKTTAKKETLFDMLVSWSGRVLETARDVQAEFLIGSQQPAWACRGIPKAAENPVARSADASFTSAVKKSGGFRILLTYHTAPERYLELDIFDDIENVEVRPFSIQVYDEQGTNISPSITVNPAQSAPRFPNPEPGLYVFEVEWFCGHDSITLSIKPEQ